MTDGDAIYRSVLADPDEDLHRLAMADYLEENGDPGRARFVRTQVAHPDWFGDKPLDGRSLRPPEFVAACRWLDREGDRAAERLLGDDGFRQGGRGRGCGVGPVSPVAPWERRWTWRFDDGAERGFRLMWQRGFVNGACVYGPCHPAVTEAVLSFLFRHLPLTRFALDGADPYVADSGRASWYPASTQYWHPPPFHPESDLPDWLWGLLSGHEDQDPDAKLYRDPEAARADLSATLVARGRELAGLPPLPGAK